jgi:hypothetical protein
MLIGNSIILGIHRYRKEFVDNNKLPDLYCSKNDGTHLPLVIKLGDDDNVYLYCMSCDFEKRAGLVTLDSLLRLMEWRNENPEAPLLDTEVKI